VGFLERQDIASTVATMAVASNFFIFTTSFFYQNL